MIRPQKTGGASTTDRAGLETVHDFFTSRDTLVVTLIDRPARSIGDLQDIVRALNAKGASLRATEPPIYTTSAAGKAFLHMLGVFAEFEINLRRERQVKGIAKAIKAAGAHKGRPSSIGAAQIHARKTELGDVRLADENRPRRA